MIGQHLYLRSKNEQDSAGSWTVAMTDGICDRSTVKSEIEPRCVLDGIFANYALNNGKNSVLKIYNCENNIKVVSRSYWEIDRITDGRKGAYTFSYILSDQDANRFLASPGGAFDSARYETYDSVIKRREKNKRKAITLDYGNRSLDLFAPVASAPDMSIFTHIGFDADVFTKLMEGLYYAINNNTHLVIILPQEYRIRWIQNGDDITERLAYAIMMLMPFFSRNSFTFASNWGCSLKADTLEGISLVFANPENDEDKFRLFKDGYPYIDMDSRGESNIGVSSAPHYFEFLFDNLNNYEIINEFWSYAQNNLELLFELASTNTNAIECAFLMWRLNDGSFLFNDGITEKTILEKESYLLASSIFAGVGDRIPVAEEYLLSETVKIKNGDIKLSKEDLEQALTGLISKDLVETSHQKEEYLLLTGLLKVNSCSEKTIQILLSELDKLNRNANKYFAEIYNNSVSEHVSGQVLSFSSQLLDKAGKSGLTELLENMQKAGLRWQTVDGTPDDDRLFEYKIRLVEAALISHRVNKARNLFTFLFNVIKTGNQNRIHAAEQVLETSEDKGIFDDGSEYRNEIITAFKDTILDGKTCFCVLDNNNALACYRTLYRFARIDSSALEEYLREYKRQIQSYDSIVNGDKKLHAVISEQCRELEALFSEPPISDQIKYLYSGILLRNIEIRPKFRLNIASLVIIVERLKSGDNRFELQDIFAKLSQRMNDEDRDVILRKYKDDPMVMNPRKMFVEKLMEKTPKEADTFYNSLVKLFSEIGDERSVLNDISKNPQSYASRRFKKWYKSTIENKTFNSNMEFSAKISALIDEHNFICGIFNDGSDIYEYTIGVCAELIERLLVNEPNEELVKLGDLFIVRFADYLAGYADYPEDNNTNIARSACKKAQYIKLIRDIDRTNGDLLSLDRICHEASSKRLSIDIIATRLRWIIEKKEVKTEVKLAYALYESVCSNNNEFNVKKYINRCYAVCKNDPKDEKNRKVKVEIRALAKLLFILKDSDSDSNRMSLPYLQSSGAEYSVIFKTLNDLAEKYPTHFSDTTTRRLSALDEIVNGSDCALSRMVHDYFGANVQVNNNNTDIKIDFRFVFVCCLSASVFMAMQILIAWFFAFGK